MHKLLVASLNLKKLKELQEILRDHLKSNDFNQLSFFSLADFPHVREVVEDGKTFEENAVKKALGYAGQTGLLTLADDSGLCVDALNGEPGVYSARYAGEHGDDLANCKKVISQIGNVPEKKRTGRFECVIAIARPNQLLGTSKGRVDGVILSEMRGSGGFGYDPLFFYPPFGKTFAEVSNGEKHSVSHRAKALKGAAELLSKSLCRNKL